MANLTGSLNGRALPLTSNSTPDPMHHTTRAADPTHAKLGVDELRAVAAATQRQFVVFQQLKPPVEGQTGDVNEICARLEQFCAIWTQVRPLYVEPKDTAS